eukprot:1145261-Pelagomonas_calceolata.AAC.3
MADVWIATLHEGVEEITRLHGGSKAAHMLKQYPAVQENPGPFLHLEWCPLSGHKTPSLDRPNWLSSRTSYWQLRAVHSLSGI